MLILVPVRYRVHQTDRDGDLPLLGYVELDRFDDSWIAEQGGFGRASRAFFLTKEEAGEWLIKLDELQPSRES